jgi:arylsulfatase A-like enzyme
VKNVVLLTIDTLRADVLKCYGNQESLSPFLDSLYDRCTVFTRCQAAGPYTQASFPGLLASKYFYECIEGGELRPAVTLVSEPLQRAGIATAAFHSNPYLCDVFGWNRGWDHFYDSMDEEDDLPDLQPYIKGDVINGKVDAWLEGRQKAGMDKPLFLWVHYMDVHEPYAPDPRYLERVDPSLSFTDNDYLRLFREVVLPRDTSEASTVGALHGLYKAHVAEVDAYAAALFEILERHGVLRDAAVIVTSDHGDEFGEHGGLSHDGKMYQELIHVPLLVCEPDRRGGRVCPTLVSGVDVGPTILALFGLAAEPGFRGRSLFPLEAYGSRGCYAQALGKLQHRARPSDRPVHCYREDDLKVVYREEDESWALYDLRQDPAERQSVADSSPHAEEMKSSLRACMARFAPGPGQPSP